MNYVIYITGPFDDEYICRIFTPKGVIRSHSLLIETAERTPAKALIEAGTRLKKFEKEVANPS